MNESHAQFFRELRELMKKHGAEMWVTGDHEDIMVSLSSPVADYSFTYFDAERDFACSGSKRVFFDAAKEEEAK